MVARYREKTTLPSNCRATFYGKFKVIFTKWGGFAATCGVKERIAAPMTHDRPSQVPAAGCWRCWCGVRHGGQGRFQSTSLAYVRRRSAPGIVSEDSIIFREAFHDGFQRIGFLQVSELCDA